MSFGALSVLDQIGRVDKRVNDPRGTLPTGMTELDELLHRGGLAPKTFVVLAGRTHTRKTTVTLNFMARLLEQGRAVGFVGLDESQESYTSKLMSAITGASHEAIEQTWNEQQGAQLKERFAEAAAKFTISTGYRPTPQDLDVFMDESEALTGHTPEVIFIDYISLLDRDKYSGAEVQRISRLVEAIQVWTNESEVVTVALHQVGRMDEGSGRRYHGDTPLSLESLKYGGEEIADIVLGTYRPSLDPVGNMTYDEASAANDKLTEEDWETRRNRVETYKDSTFLQLLKNRPGVHLDHKGIQLLSLGTSMKMRTPLEGAPEQERKIHAL
jgi:replicative DNA helicase